MPQEEIYIYNVFKITIQLHSIRLLKIQALCG